MLIAADSASNAASIAANTVLLAIGMAAAWFAIRWWRRRRDDQSSD